MPEGPYKLPPGWRWVRLGEIFRLKNGKFIRTRDLISNGNVTVYGSNGIIGFTNNYLVNFKTLAIGRVGACGAVHIVNPPAWISDNAMYVDSWLTEVDLNFIALAIKQLNLEKVAKQGSQPSISQKQIYCSLIPLPPLSEQRRIVARIEELMSRMREARRLREETQTDTDRLWQSVLAEVFPKPNSSLPPGWQWVRLGEISKKPQYGYTQSAVFDCVGPKFLRISDIQNGLVDWEKVPYCVCDRQTLEKYKLNIGDILFARSGATTGKTFLIKSLPYEAVFASYLIRVVIFTEKLLPEFAFYFFQSFSYWDQIKPRGAAQPNMNAKAIQKLLLPLPPLSEQRRIVSYLDEVQAKITALKKHQEETTTALNRLEQAILEKAFRGEL